LDRKTLSQRSQLHMSSVLQVQQLYTAGIPLLEAYLQSLPSSRKEKGSGVKRPNPYASSKSVERPIRSQKGIY